MKFDKTIRENLDGKYLIIYANQFQQGIEYAFRIQISQIQIRGILGADNIDTKVDFKELEKLSNHLRVISFAEKIDNIINVESIYSLINIEKIYFQQKQKFAVDILKFPKLVHLGSEYWKGLTNFGKSNSLNSLVIFKFPHGNLKQLSELKKLQILHIYSSKINRLDGIEKLPLEELFLSRNSYLEDINTIKELENLKELDIEKCKKITDYNFLDSLKDRVRTNIFK